VAGGYAGYVVSSWVAGFSQHWLILFLSAIIVAFIVGWILQMLLERLVWRRLGWR
jgi:branched-subunit amino acid ABC-type transport system permease component